jgi:hypothetical protein
LLQAFRKFDVVVPVFLPYSVAAYDHQFFLPVSLELDDVWHAGDGLLVEGQSFHFLMAEISQGAGEVEAVDSSLHDGNTRLLYPCLFNWVFGFMVVGEGQTFGASYE